MGRTQAQLFSVSTLLYWQSSKPFASAIVLFNTVVLEYQQNLSTIPQNRFLPSTRHAFIQQMYHHVLIVIWQIIRHTALKKTCVFKRDTLTHPQDK